MGKRCMPSTDCARGVALRAATVAAALLEPAAERAGAASARAEAVGSASEPLGRMPNPTWTDAVMIPPASLGYV